MPEGKDAEYGDDHIDGHDHHLVEAGDFTFKAFLGIEAESQGSEILIRPQIDQGREEIVPSKLKGENRNCGQHRLGVEDNNAPPDPKIIAAINSGCIAQLFRNTRKN